ncbi:Hypothetical Protein RSKD131_3500 [Cereibacter sphaeroides KD131]|nr:Hypothetical Protein RSKD131_3500 [Cereibacter sphaeroides KD131]
MCFDGHSGSSLNRAFFLTWAFSGVLQGGSTVSFATGAEGRRHGRTRSAPHSPRRRRNGRRRSSTAGSARADPMSWRVFPSPARREAAALASGRRGGRGPCAFSGCELPCDPVLRQRHDQPSSRWPMRLLRPPARVRSRASEAASLTRNQPSGWPTRRLPLAGLRQAPRCPGRAPCRGLRARCLCESCSLSFPCSSCPSSCWASGGSSTIR